MMTGKRDLAFAEIVTHTFAKLGLVTRIIQRVVNQLKGNAQIAAVGFQRFLLVARAV